MYRIVQVKTLPDYFVALEFNDGTTGEVSLKHLVGKGVFSIWSDPHKFEQVAIGSSGELSWEGEVDLCPDALYLEVTGKSPESILSPVAEDSHAGDQPILRHYHQDVLRRPFASTQSN